MKGDNLVLLFLNEILICWVQSFSCQFWEHDPTTELGIFALLYIKLAKTHTIYYNEIKQEIKYLVHSLRSTFQNWNAKNKICCGTVHNGDIFLFLKFGFFAVKLGKKHTFCNWEHVACASGICQAWVNSVCSIGYQKKPSSDELADNCQEWQEPI